ncbi:hypothetical protein D0Z07_2692 [Hyphodiscus hymeniophilus]|uniref:Zn(2)-C6 fungal-type domain-containing protein n=1 Tax=Hyphodiscus hymeniophilus TaxID=353542 RepID=A0A9P7AZD8_9HELO|nr:hypothetical protein D0Z07_2692 [Hyphodiscus hymeniophilus]
MVDDTRPFTQMQSQQVKCTEERPTCMCLRLGHECDYNPRLSFRDDTPRVMERMNEEVSTIGSVWDPDASEIISVRDQSLEDLLPPFAALITDEDRERKGRFWGAYILVTGSIPAVVTVEIAELQNPGTYHVIANPRSFTSLPEYRDEATVSISGLIHSDPDLHEKNASLADGTGDPNIIFLETFDEAPRSVFTRSFSPAHFPLSHAKQSLPSNIRIPIDPSTSLLDTARRGGRDHQLLQHYRAAISPRIIHARLNDDEDLFETAARTYPPLFHAMMALAALDISNRHGIRSSQALEHYQSVIPALKMTLQSPRDSYSDGAFFTHFILLLYEIAAVGYGENMWQHHSDQLKRIIALRRQAYGIETYDFIVWTICSIDVYALLSSNGTGAFVDSLLMQNMIPPPDKCVPQLSHGQSPVPYTEDQPFLTAILDLNQQVMMLAFEVGKVARDLRKEDQRQKQSAPDPGFQVHRRARLQHLHRHMEHSQDTWRSRFPVFGTPFSDSHPPRVFACINHVDSEKKIKACVAEIFQVANLVTSKEGSDQQYIIFPLFMAGIATKDGQEKDLCLRLIRAVGQLSYGRTVESVAEFLERIHEKQRDALQVFGHASAVDWIEDMELSGQRLIVYGL